MIIRTKILNISLILTVLLVICNSELFGQNVPFHTTPDWISNDLGVGIGGAAWADINKDGWLDLLFTSGFDTNKGKLILFYNNNGTLPLSPNWLSSDNSYNSNLCIGDVNADGFPEVAVSVYNGTSYSLRGRIKLYKNNSGTLSSTPIWISQDSMYTNSCAFGDADNDGDLDLAVACGDVFYGTPEKNRIYYNNNGNLTLLPVWQSSNLDYSYDVTWGDFNSDARLDLAFVNNLYGKNFMYLNYGDSIGKIPAWISSDFNSFGYAILAGDIDNNGFIDLAVSDNWDDGSFKIYKNYGGVLQTFPYFHNTAFIYGSGISLIDIDFDNDLDIVLGILYQGCGIFLNSNGNFSYNAQWTSYWASVSDIEVGDYNNDGLDTTVSNFIGNGLKKLFYVQRKPIQKLIYVKVGNNILTLTDYCFDMKNGWVSLKNAPPNAFPVEIKTITTHSPDFVASDFYGEQLVYNNLYVIGIINITGEIPKKFELYQNYPNPFNPETKISFDNPSEVFIQLKVFDVTGKEIATLVNEKLKSGTYVTSWNALDFSSGVYLYKLTAGDFSQTKKMVLIK